MRKKNFSFTYSFLPVNDDGVFFNKSLLRRILVKEDADILMGDTTHEGSYFLWYYYKDLINCTSLKLTKDKITGDCIVNKKQFENIVENVTRVFGYVEEKKNKILKYYSVTDYNATEAAQLFLSSVLYDCGLKHFADDLVEETNVKKPYVYMFNHRSSEKKTSWPDSFGTVHAALIEFLFGRPFRYPENYDSTKIETEKKMSEIVMKLYSKFAYEGKPNNDEWKQYTKSDEFVISLDSEYTEYLDQYDISHLKECDIIMPKLKREDSNSKKIQIYNN
uniref:COesterase domain-containing protein n=1 Tax=Parastrongyloides trichosuri TaxID=131310 RepID=A0A0N4Z3E6_PARTI